MVKRVKDALISINNIHGAGIVRTVVFPITFAGVRWDPKYQSGIVVRQFQYGMDARRFRVMGNKVRFLGKVRKLA